MHDEDTPWREPTPTLERPTGSAACARAATAAEARFRVDYPNSRARASRIFALDPGAAEAMYRITEEPWNGAHFLTVAGEPAAGAAPALSNPDGSRAELEAELEGADVVALLSSTGANRGAAEAIAAAARARNVMCAALALAGTGRSDRVVNALRPFASVLVVATDEEFIPAMLTALRA